MNKTVTTVTVTAPAIEEKQGFIGRIITAVCDKLVNRICENEMHLSHEEAMMFMNYGGYGYDMSAMYQYMGRDKYSEETF